jgi:hypothetical protein
MEVSPNAKPAYLILAPNFLANSTKFFLCRYRYGSSPSTHYRQNYPPPIANMKTTWKDIPVVPTSQEFLDIVLSRTQRRLPTQIRAGFKISRIRGATVSYHTIYGSANPGYYSFLHSQSQIYCRNLHRASFSNTRSIPATTRHTSVS